MNNGRREMLSDWLFSWRGVLWLPRRSRHTSCKSLLFSYSAPSPLLLFHFHDGGTLLWSNYFRWKLCGHFLAWQSKNKLGLIIQQTKNRCIRFVQCWPNICPTLYQHCDTDVLCLLNTDYMTWNVSDSFNLVQVMG